MFTLVLVSAVVGCVRDGYQVDLPRALPLLFAALLADAVVVFAVLK